MKQGSTDELGTEGGIATFFSGPLWYESNNIYLQTGRCKWVINYEPCPL